MAAVKPRTTPLLLAALLGLGRSFSLELENDRAAIMRLHTFLNAA